MAVFAMRQLLIRFSFVLLSTLNMNSSAVANETLVFISEFAASKEGGISVFRLDEKSSLLESAYRIDEVEHPFYLALSPTKNLLYSVHAATFGGSNNEHVAAFEFTSSQSKLLNRQSSLGTASCYLDVDATGKTVLVANYSTGSVASLPIEPDGTLGEKASFVQHKGSSVNKERQEGPHAHCFTISPDNRFAFAADLGLDQIRAYCINPDSNQLVPTKQCFVRTIPGAGPRHLTFHPNEKYVYVINELANSITLFDYEKDTSFLIERTTISTLPADFSGTSHTADLKITPNGQFLYGTNRGHDSIAAYRIGDDGQLTLLRIWPSLGKGPQNLAISPSGELLFCANMPGNNVIVFRINESDGALSPTGQELKLTKPSCIVIRSSDSEATE